MAALHTDVPSAAPCGAPYRHTHTHLAASGTKHSPGSIHSSSSFMPMPLRVSWLQANALLCQSSAPGLKIVSQRTSSATVHHTSVAPRVWISSLLASLAHLWSAQHCEIQSQGLGRGCHCQWFAASCCPHPACLALRLKQAGTLHMVLVFDTV
jgi:hypothetical protein